MSLDRSALIRRPWDSFPDVIVHAEVAAVKDHPDYAAAKSGNAAAATRLVVDRIDSCALDAIGALCPDHRAVLVPVHAVEDAGVNAIPLVLAEEIGRRLDWTIALGVVQTNVVGHTGASGFARLARPPLFLSKGRSSAPPCSPASYIRRR